MLGDEIAEPLGIMQVRLVTGSGVEAVSPNQQVRARNESLDLSCMIRAACLRLGADKARFWLSPPSWARPLESNSDVITPEQRREIKAEVLARPAERVVRRSSYLG